MRVFKIVIFGCSKMKTKIHVSLQLAATTILDSLNFRASNHCVLFCKLVFYWCVCSVITSGSSNGRRRYVSVWFRGKVLASLRLPVSHSEHFHYPSGYNYFVAFFLFQVIIKTTTVL